MEKHLSSVPLLALAGSLSLSLSLIALVLFPSVNSHGRLLDPPNRSSLWRFPEFEQYNPQPNYEDNQLFCGGVDIQHGVNGGRCGECGDEYNATKPRANENGGFFGQGVVVREYASGSWINIHIELTAWHNGHFEIRLCPLQSPTAVEEEVCFLQNVLEFLESGGTKYPVPDDSLQHYHLHVKLPSTLTCDRCVIQWHYSTANTWGTCPNGTEMVGCGPQETFRGCSDVRIY